MLLRGCFRQNCVGFHPRYKSGPAEVRLFGTPSFDFTCLVPTCSALGYWICFVAIRSYIIVLDTVCGTHTKNAHWQVAPGGSGRYLVRPCGTNITCSNANAVWSEPGKREDNSPLLIFRGIFVWFSPSLVWLLVGPASHPHYLTLFAKCLFFSILFLRKVSCFCIWVVAKLPNSLALLVALTCLILNIVSICSVLCSSLFSNSILSIYVFPFMCCFISQSWTLTSWISPKFWILNSFSKLLKWCSLVTT